MEWNLDDVVAVNNEEAHRFEASVNGQRALIAYRRFPGRIVFVHTEVPAPLEGHGLAGKLARTALDFARAQHLGVVPLCPYVASLVRRHPEYHELLSTDDRKKLFYKPEDDEK